MKIAVVGVGTMGAQVFWQLAQRGHEVVGYETYNPGHANGAAGGESRLYRTIQVEHPGYAPIADLASQLYDKLERESGFQVREITGALVMGDSDSPYTQAALNAAESSVHPTRILTRKEAHREFPQFRLDENDLTIWDGHGGIIRPELTVAAAAQLGQSYGGKLVVGKQVTGIEEHSSGVRVLADGQTEDFDRVIATPGAWTNELFPEMQGILEMRRLVSAWFFPKKAGHLAGVLPFIRTKPTYAYGLPYADRTAMKLGLGTTSEDAVETPRHIDLRAPQGHVEAFKQTIQRFMPGLQQGPMRTASYFESYTSSGFEYVGTAPTSERVVIMAGFSGHGFKMAPAWGVLGTDLVEGKQPQVSLEFLSGNE